MLHLCVYVCQGPGNARVLWVSGDALPAFLGQINVLGVENVSWAGLGVKGIKMSRVHT